MEIYWLVHMSALVLIYYNYLSSTAVIILTAGYLTQLQLRRPSSKTATTKNESWIMWLMASSLVTNLARIVTLMIAAHHATISHAKFSSRKPPHAETMIRNTCPVPEYLDEKMFTLSPQVLASLALLCAGSYIRSRAFTQLGNNFTYRLTKPDHLVTDGLYAYVRHPSYTGLLAVLFAKYSLFSRQRGVFSCWAPLVDERLVIDDRIGYLASAIVFAILVWMFMVKRVEAEETMMEKEFGQSWREYCKGTKKFIPFVY
ncbi:hypothetical protein BU23DRAFT_560432 [Bimuria novae-zelandiae CBS 107.79]|uniref:Protein-S-isoprenylcysteine O-methyltransferase n=1 Tax=Bimuria novae-zelandiae CBS 107.79 TaxID=1447943 RepID=A0A6A5UTN6_9PLEO|nr:hypothetical protein BU23DRAFT_560432 [Bimuria novae-zelandiae CBS 107.79]